MRTLNCFCVCALLLGSLAGQSTAPPADKGEVFLSKLPKVDKSRQRDLKGLVKDDAGNPLDGAIVQLKDLRTGSIVDFRTKEDGRYLFYDLNMDQDYELRVLKPGFETSPPKKLSKYDSRKPASLNFELAKAQKS